MSTLVLVGATGLVGRSALEQALTDPRITRVVAPTRQPLEPHTKLDNPLVSFDRLPDDAPWWKTDAVVCTLGTTIRKAGSQEAFRRVDHDYVLAVAKLARARGARAFALNSAMGANPRSRIFYSRTKGEIEDALRRCGFPSLTIVRPSLIGGARGEFRLAEYLAIRIVRAAGPLVPRRYRVVPNAAVAKALLDGAVTAPPGEHIIESDALV
jgi:uncharacterized protein YbjT (DUF2867 family)